MWKDDFSFVLGIIVTNRWQRSSKRIYKTEKEEGKTKVLPPVAVYLEFFFDIITIATLLWRLGEEFKITTRTRTQPCCCCAAAASQ